MQPYVSQGNELISSPTNFETPETGDLIEIWDVRRQWIAKWTIDGSSIEGGVSGKILSILFYCFIINESVSH